ncbi:MAG TPA: 16S rRNA (guanine(527)-N(7))-methyltransferase RsmG [Burkholderiaceae bacterium]|nr:16S rRNA (guanine(527)-N(7))-methyltransferase RsmG [Burkholderiaceae bacterium]
MNTDRLSEGLAQLGLPADAATADALDAYLDLLVRWNGVYNLTSVRDREKMRPVHLLDSLSILRPLQQAADGATAPLLVDVGTGAGLPGLPLALLWPTLRLVLVEPVGKKVAFLRQAVGALGLQKRVTVIGARVEQVQATGLPPVAGKPTGTIPLPDLIVSRAFASLRDFSAAVAHLTGPATRVFAMKGQMPSDEIAELSSDWQVLADQSLEVPELDARRHLIELGRRPPGGV